MHTFLYTNKRRSSIEVSQEELESVFTLLVKCYKEEWLNAKQENPIQRLWQRDDELATSELYTLGTAIRTVDIINHKWTLDLIKKSKSLDQKNRQGAIFELCGLSLLHHTDHPVKPARENQPGYDCVLYKSENKQMRISIKNYGLSERQRNFETKASLIEQDIVRLLKKYKYPPVIIAIDSPVHYPEKKCWDTLSKNLDEIFKSKRDSNDNFAAIVENNIPCWTIMIQPMVDLADQYHLNYQTYTVILTSVYHPNEHLNLYSKLQEACANLTKHSTIEDENQINALLLHLPPSASITNCFSWLESYFEEYPQKPISLVILYQPSVATELQNNASFIHHCCKIFIREKLNKWNMGYGNFTFTVPVGKVSDYPVLNTLVIEHPDREKETISIDERYIFQRGEHYLKMKSHGKGGFIGNIQKLGSGLFTNIVVEFPGQPESAAIGGRFPPADELLIL